MPIRWRLTLFNALAIGAILLTLGLVLFFLARGVLFSTVEETTENRALAAARGVQSGDALEVDEETGRLELDDDDAESLTLDGVFIIVRDAEGEVLAQTVDLRTGEGARDGVWRAALEAGRPAYGPAELSKEAPDFVYAVPVDPAGGAARVVEAGKSYRFAEEALRGFARVLVAGLAAAFAFALVGAYFLAGAALTPVAAVARAAREITSSDLGRRLPVANPGDEIGRLATTINELLSRLQEAFDRREEALARRDEALERQRRFAADASHELRTPLTSIAGYAKMLGGWAGKDPEAAEEASAAVKEESARMLKMVEELLVLTRGDEGIALDLARVDLRMVAEEAARAARATANGEPTVEALVPEEAVFAVVDRDRMRQALSALLDNAIKYTPQGGRVSVAVRAEGGAAVLEVSDTGVGIPEDELPQIFERFRRADPAHQDGGAGLGLSIAKQIVVAHGGEILATSTLREGSTFEIRLPDDGPQPREVTRKLRREVHDA